MKVILIIPAYNEEETIDTVIRGIYRKMEEVDLVEVLVVDDGSTDATVTKATKAGADVILRHKANKGVGTAFSTGIDAGLRMGADIIVSMDADGQFNPKDVRRLIEPILRGEADFVTGSRFIDRSYSPKMPWIKRVGNKFFTRLVSYFTGQKLTDTQCGFRAYSREAAMRLHILGEFTYTQEVFIDLLSKGMTAKEVPIQVTERESKSKVVTHWYSYGLKALVIIIRSFIDYRPLKFFGPIGLVTLIPGVGLGGFIVYHWITTGRTSPYTSLLYLVVVLIVMGLVLLLLALLADMIGRLRKTEEELLYHSKLQEYENVDRQR